MASQEPLSLLEFQGRFKDELACRDHLFDVGWLFQVWVPVGLL